MSSMSENNQKELRKQVMTLPRLPGVYLMKDRAGAVIYIGKAKDLRARVRSYLGVGDGRVQIAYLMRRVVKIEQIVTEDEEQAFILERDLIKRFKPRYNIRLKDDRAYLSVRIDQTACWPRIELVRKIENDGAEYFGPFSKGNELRELLEVIRNVVPLRTCADTVLHNRQRPCLEHQIKRCAAPCCLPVDREQYGIWIKQALALIQGRVGVTIEQLKQERDLAAADLNFEEAAAIRDRINLLEQYASGQQIVSHRGESRDVFAIYREGSWIALSVLLVRNGRIADSKNFSFQNVYLENDQILESVITQYYENDREIPEEIVVESKVVGGDIIASVLKKKRGAALKLTWPQRGLKYRLVKLAKLNAKQYFLQVVDADSRYAELSKKLAEMLSLAQVPRRIECVDISNLQGSDIVGAAVVFYDGQPEKAAYKRYLLKVEGKPDDFASIYEVVSRRLRRANETGTLPDLLVIDGGSAQLKKALLARDEQGISLDIVAMAKLRKRRKRMSDEEEFKPERIFLPGRAASIELAADDAVTHFLQRVRDEAHRYVIGFHRQRRSKRALDSILDDIAGLGSGRKSRLLAHFGSVGAMRKASVEQLARVGRMSLLIAKNLHNSLGKSNIIPD